MNTLADRLAQALAELKWTQEDLARRSGVSQVAIHKILTGKTASTRKGPELAAAMGISVDWLLTGSGTLAITTESQAAGAHEYVLKSEVGMDTVVIPRFCLAASAGGGCWPPDDPIIDRMVFKQSWIRRMFPAVSLAALAVMSVHGDSMSPTLRDGDLMLIDRSIEEIGPEGVYVLTIEGDLYVKRVQREPGQLIIKSDNAMYRTWEVPRGALEQVRVHGRMVYFWRGERG